MAARARAQWCAGTFSPYGVHMKHALAAFAASLSLSTSALADESAGWSASVTPEAAREDLAALYDGLRSAHYDLYVNRPKSEYDALYAETAGALEEPRAAFEQLRVVGSSLEGVRQIENRRLEGSE